MTNATYRDCRAGFDIFRRSGGRISGDALNAELVESGYRPVSRRTYGHYRKLLRAGFDRYISINRFDVSRAAAPFEDPSSNPRYRFVPSDEGVRLLVAKGSELYVVGGRASQVGEVGAMVRVAEPEFIEGLRRIRVAAGNMVSVRFLESGVTVEGRLVEIDLESVPALLEIEFGTVASLYEVGVRVPIPMISSRITLQAVDAQPIQLDVASRRLYYFFDLVEGLRSIVNRSLAANAENNYAEPPVLVQLRVASPALVELLGARELVDLLKLMGPGLLAYGAYQFPQRRKEWHEGTGQKLENELKRQKLEEVELANEERRATALLVSGVAARLGAVTNEQVEEVGRVIEEQVAPALRRLARQGVSGLEVEEGAPQAPKPPRRARKSARGRRR